ncbi:hypothetical protein ACOI22_03455 [Glaciecola sp. 2405UD65-10]|uniref:hypothetical protein n=1 Tax=Glaciecola sp. 2405UD65-10 TaxID=3397244 RepID=UPI003B593877
MSREGNINDNGPIKSGRKKENRNAYADNYERIFGKKKTKPTEDVKGEKAND